MKKGKTSKIQGFNTSKIVYGTVDSINFKSLYLNLQTWVEPINEPENWTRVVLNLSRAVKHSVYETLDKELFDDSFIVDLDLRSSGLTLGKKSFMNLEINFFLNEEELDFKSKEIKENLKTIVTRIYDENFNNNDYFNFTLTKSKKIEEEYQTESV
jgi:hypothetical protein